MTRRSSFVLGVALLSSCRPDAGEATSSVLTFIVESDPGIPVQGATVVVNGDQVGATDERGALSVEVAAKPGGPLRIGHRCPRGYRDADAPKVLRSREFKGIAARVLPIEVTLRCRHESRLAVFVVRAEGLAGLPVLLDGREVARTNDAGVAHFSVRGAPGTDFVLKLDTNAHPRLTPQFPSHQRRLADADQIFVVTQTFDTRRKARRKRPRPPRITKIE